MRKPRRPKPTSPPRVSPTKTTRLFIYLWRKKHGQADDRSGFFVRFFDRKVAGLVGYRDARANYAMLREIPLRLREHAKNKQSDVETAKARVAEVERQALIADGIEPLEAKGAVARAAVEKAEQAVATITAALQAIEAEREKVTGDDAVHGRAADLLAETLAREDLRQLYDDAVRTPTKADDQAISAISAARSKLQQADGEAAQIRAQIREMAGRRGELEGARDRARSVGYHDPRGTFGGSGQDVLGQVIGGILGGMAERRRSRPRPSRQLPGSASRASIPISGGAAAARPGRGLGVAVPVVARVEAIAAEVGVPAAASERPFMSDEREGQHRADAMSC